MSSNIRSRVLEMMPVENIVDAIEEDHRDLKKFIHVMKDDKAKLSEKRIAVRSFMSLLRSHSLSEEKALYSRCAKARFEKLNLASTEGYVEHHLAELLMKSIPLTKNKKEWSAKVKVLAELVEHHIKEEEVELLPLVRKHFARLRQQEMSRDFLILRRKSQQQVTEENSGALQLV